MTGYSFGDVILVSFPFTDQSSSKQRPAAIVSSARYNAERRDLVIVAITSRLGGASFGEIAIHRWQEAGLLRPSAIKPVFATIERGLVRRQLGRLEEADGEALHGMLRAVLG